MMRCNRVLQCAARRGVLAARLMGPPMAARLMRPPNVDYQLLTGFRHFSTAPETPGDDGLPPLKAAEAMQKALKEEIDWVERREADADFVDYIEENGWNIEKPDDFDVITVTRQLEDYNVTIRFTADLDPEDELTEDEATEQDVSDSDEDAPPKPEEGRDDDDETFLPHSFKIIVARNDDSSPPLTISCHATHDSQLKIETMVVGDEAADQAMNQTNYDEEGRRLNQVVKALASSRASDAEGGAVTDDNGEKASVEEAQGETTAEEEVHFEDLTEDTKNAMIDFIQSLGIDDRTALLVQHHSREERWRQDAKRIGHLKKFFE